LAGSRWVGQKEKEDSGVEEMRGGKNWREEQGGRESIVSRSPIKLCLCWRERKTGSGTTLELENLQLDVGGREPGHARCLWGGRGAVA